MMKGHINASGRVGNLPVLEEAHSCINKLGQVPLGKLSTVYLKFQEIGFLLLRIWRIFFSWESDIINLRV